ncbi:MAG: glycosyltransferase family 39 protein [Candidatus Thermoplasmatota archaeon]|nr:glycosyltransferase family 39 protein [Candidatus Thermoplasmatota archaeon]
MRSYHLLLLMVILIAGSFLRISGSADSDLVIDEATKVDAVEDYRDGKFWVNLEHPPLEKYLILSSISVFGVHDWSVKLPNVIMGCLTPLLIFIFVSRIGKGVWPGLVGAAISSLSPVMIGYSLIAKEDTLLNFLSLIVVLLLVKVADIGIPSCERGPEEQGVGNVIGSDPVGKRGVIHFIVHRLDPRPLNRTEIALGLLVGFSLASKYTMLFLLFAWSIFLFISRRNFLKEKGPRIMTVAVIVFATLSWYYLNPYWLMLGIFHWMVESVGGHLTFFMGASYQYPPPWFYPVVFLGRIHPLVLFSSVGLILISLIGLVRSMRRMSRTSPERNRKSGSILEKMKGGMEQDSGLWFLMFWAMVIFLIMTVLPFKGVRYIQWIIVPLIALSAVSIWRVVSSMKGRIKGPLALLVVILLMSGSVVFAHPYYTEWSYVFDEDSGVRDYNGQGHKEALRWIEGSGEGGQVSMRWTELGEYYYQNVTGPVSSMDEVIEGNVSYILIYIYDLQRAVHENMTDIANSRNCELVHEVVHHSVTVIWIYRVDPFIAP